MKRKMAWEWNWPRLTFGWQQFTIFSAVLSVSFKGDHAPGFHCSLLILGVLLLDFGYYNIYHEDDL